MPIPVWLRNKAGAALHTARVGKHVHLVIELHSRVDTHFKSAAMTVASTVIVVRPKSGEAIVVTDILYSAEKVNNGSLAIQFTDGSDTVILKSAIVTDAPVDGNISLQGRGLGWQDARIEIVGVGTNITANATVFYYHVDGVTVQSFADWDAER